MTEQEYKTLQELMIAALSHLDAASTNLRSANLADRWQNHTLSAECRASFHEHVTAAGELLSAIQDQMLLHSCDMPHC